MEILCMNHTFFDSTAKQIGFFQRNTARNSEIQACKIERKLSLQFGEIEDSFGNVKTSAINDGKWQKQAYNKNCNSKSGVRVIVSVKTSKILDYEVLSIDCAVC